MKKGEKVKKRKFQLTRKTGLLIMLIGVAFQFLNIITYGLWKIDIDIFGAMIFILGVVITLIRWKK
jgi:hypothetical protein